MNTIVRNSILAATLFFSATAFAQMGPGHGRGMRDPQIPNLTAEQSTKLQALRKAHWDQNAPIRQQLMAKKSEMHSLWLSPKPDRAAIVAKQKEISDLQAKLAEKAIDHRFEMRQVLTPEQLAQAGDFGQGRGKGRRGGQRYW
ncbi:MAG: Zinc resistance-associated protein precursor [Betaproteobacteria bacterium ADurb.Bin341]|nr:MAG: Zinc resistance-associated protein precursor [Betaproteobacteria bacterium ADurb.Bin341]